MSYKEKLEKRKALFSLTSYMETKARKRAEKLQHRADKKNHVHDHEHHDHEHTHEEPQQNDQNT